MQAMTESDTVGLGSANSRLAQITALFQANADAVFNVAYRIVWNRADAEDVVQSTFIQVYLKMDQLEDKSKARSWLLQIAYRQALNVLRRRKDQPTDPTDLPDRFTSHDSTAEPALRNDLRLTIQTAIDSLPQNLRMAVVLRDVEGLPMREVASVLDIGQSAAKMRVARAREQLRTELSGLI